MSRIAPMLATRIDRLSWHAHSFHRFAHHPLCVAYASELIVIGRKGRVCRGCVSAALGMVAGLAVGWFLPRNALLEAILLGAALTLGLLSLKWRLPKWTTRLLPAGCASAAFMAAVRGSICGDTHSVFIGSAVLFTGLFGFAVYRKRGPNRARCEACPERSCAKVCSGLAPILRRERAFQRVSQRWMLGA